MSSAKRDDGDNEKRDIPPMIKKLLAIDVELTKKFVAFSLNFLPMRSLKTNCKLLEYSCHGLLWLPGWLALCWFLDNQNLYQMQMNLFIGLIIDIIIVACIKALTRRRRPTVNDDFMVIGPDKFSFPSGHASRAVLILLFFTVLNPVSILFWPPLLAWAVSVAMSRLLLLRHHILDILGGVALAVFEALLLSIIWLEKDTAAWIMSCLSDERLPGYATQEETF